MSQVCFWVLELAESRESANAEFADAHLKLACEQATLCYRNQQKVFVYTDTQQQAEQIDELLWSFEPDSFVPHNLLGEGPKYGAPVEISWQAPTSYRQVLINLASQVPPFAQQFNQIYDFVPLDEQLKQLARQRFKQYRAQQFQLDTKTVSLAQPTTN